MAASLDSLMKQLSAQQSAYTPLTQEQMQTKASARYQAEYDQKRQEARQTYQAQDAALARQLADEQADYEARRASSDQSYRRQLSEADRQSLSRGMQRSSYNGATLAGIRLAGEKARQNLTEQQARRERELGEKRADLSGQLSRQLSQSQRANELSYLDDLEAREYTRAAESRKSQTDLALKLYEYRSQLDREAEEASRWRQEFNAKYGKRA